MRKAKQVTYNLSSLTQLTVYFGVFFLPVLLYQQQYANILQCFT